MRPFPRVPRGGRTSWGVCWEEGPSATLALVGGEVGASSDRGAGPGLAKTADRGRRCSGSGGGGRALVGKYLEQTC